MIKRDARPKVKSDYTLLRNKHKRISDGTIYENDYMTISKMDELFTADQIPVYSDSNFKFSIRQTPNSQRKHSRGKFEECVLSGGTSITPKTDENRVRLKPDYEWLKDFAYYGSAVELVRASINDIIMRFPAEIYFTPATQTFDGELYYQISNDFLIDLDTISIQASSVSNDLRYFCLSYDKYSLIKDGQETPLIDIDPDNTWSVQRLDASCQSLKNETGAWVAIVTLLGNSDTPINIYVREIDGVKFLYYKDRSCIGSRIRPYTEYIELFFDTLDDFQKVLLNRETYPLYRADFNTPYETDAGFFYTKEMYVWPSKFEYNPDVSSFDCHKPQTESVHPHMFPAEDPTEHRKKPGGTVHKLRQHRLPATNNNLPDCIGTVSDCIFL